MAVIKLETIIHAPVNIVFDLSRSIDLHQTSVAHTNEKAVAGVTKGLIGLHETVTWQARHLFKTRYFTSMITAFEPYSFFKDEMQKGDFRNFAHEHHFAAQGNSTVMTDVLSFESPFGLLGSLVDLLFMRWYLKKLLIKRNNFIKNCAETGTWQQILKHT